MFLHFQETVKLHLVNRCVYTWKLPPEPTRKACMGGGFTDSHQQPWCALMHAVFVY